MGTLRIVFFLIIHCTLLLPPVDGLAKQRSQSFLEGARRMSKAVVTPAVEEVVAQDEFRDNADVPEGLRADLTAIDVLLTEYIDEHKSSKLDHRNKFVLGVYGCPRQFGNRMHEFLNDFALAVVLGRNLVWDYTRQAEGVHAVGTLEECEKNLKRRNWLPHKNATEGMNVSYMAISDPQRVGCTDWDAIDADVISPGQMVMYQTYSLALEGTRLKGGMLRRAKTLFALGPEIAFGRLFSAAFSFEDKEIVRPTFKALRGARVVDAMGQRTQLGSVWIAMHLRHKTLADTDETRKDFVNMSWGQALAYLPGETGPCTILFATDDEVSEAYLRPLVEARGCVLVRSDLGEEDPSWSGEHGGHTGSGALRDIRLLSQADVFIGTAWSSFTQSIAELLLARAPAAPFWQCQMHQGCSNTRMLYPRPQGDLGCPASDGESTEAQMTLRIRASVHGGHKQSNVDADADAERTALVGIDALIDAYIEEHRLLQYQPSNRFVAGVYGCPKQFGNRMHEFVNSFAIGLITGRNIAWEYTKQATGTFAVGTQDECDALMQRRSWIPKLEDTANSTDAIELNSAGELACLAGDRARVLRTRRFEEYQAVALSLPGAVLGRDQALRAAQLFALGPEVAYGKLLRAAFRFDEHQVVQPTFDVLREKNLLDANHMRTEENSVWVAVHLRHQDTNLDEKGRNQLAGVAWDQTRSFIQAAGAGYGKLPCAVLMATDDERSVDIMRPWIEQAGCEIVRSDLGPVETSWSREHGEHTGLGAVRDIYLLSLADMVVGTGWSSFSQIIAELVLSRNPSAPFAQCNRRFCVTSKTAFPRPSSPQQCGA